MKKYNVEQRSPEWEQLRKTHLTGTALKGIMGTPRARQEAIYEVIYNRLRVGTDSDEDEYENPMQRGTRLEPEAIAAFEFETGMKVEQIGLCEDDENPAIGQSPDGYITDTDDTEAIEVKSMGKNHIKLWLTNEVPDEYEWQVVQYFVVNPKLKKLYFVGYNPQIPIHPIHIIEVERDEEKVKLAREKQTIFLQEVEVILSNIIKL